jgi:hypothetical protein
MSIATPPTCSSIAALAGKYLTVMLENEAYGIHSLLVADLTYRDHDSSV